MNRMMTVLIVLPLVAIFAGCASSSMATKESILPEIDVVAVKERADEALKVAQQIKLETPVLTTKITEVDGRIMSLQEEMAGISPAKLEELDTRLILLTEAFKLLQAEVKEIAARPVGITAAEDTTTPVVDSSYIDTGIVRNADSADTTGKRGSTPEAGSVKTAQKKAVKVGPTFAPSSASNLLSTPESDDYRAALRLYNSKKFEDAVKAFNQMLAQYPGGRFRDNATFWKGECYFALADYSKAIVAYEKVFVVQGSSKADDAQYKIGLSYLKLGQAEEAKIALNKLIDDYPGSDNVPRARKYLNGIK